MKNIYFISDVHLALDREEYTEKRKKHLIDFLENIISVRFVSFVLAISAIYIVSKITYKD